MLEPRDARLEMRPMKSHAEPPRESSAELHRLKSTSPDVRPVCRCIPGMSPAPARTANTCEHEEDCTLML